VVTYRPFTIGGGLGFGGVRFNGRDTGQSTSLGGFSYNFHLGFGLTPRLILLWDIEGAVVSQGPYVYEQTAHLAALQLFLTNKLFIKGGIGAAHVDQEDAFSIWYGQWGGAAMGGIGLELVQGWNWSFDIEATVTGARYRDETWTNWSLINFVINFF
jgi:hypothetical protein